MKKRGRSVDVVWDRCDPSGTSPYLRRLIQMYEKDTIQIKECLHEGLLCPIIFVNSKHIAEEKVTQKSFIIGMNHIGLCRISLPHDPCYVFMFKNDLETLQITPKIIKQNLRHATQELTAVAKFIDATGEAISCSGVAEFVEFSSERPDLIWVENDNKYLCYYRKIVQDELRKEYNVELKSVERALKRFGLCVIQTTHSRSNHVKIWEKN